MERKVDYKPLKTWKIKL